jgi:hypothetical protein
MGPEVRWFDSRLSLDFFIDLILPIALLPWGRLSLYQKLVPGEFPGGKCGRCVRLTTLPPYCAVVKKSWNLNFLESTGPLQACNGTALLLQIMCGNNSSPLTGFLLLVQVWFVQMMDY